MYDEKNYDPSFVSSKAIIGKGTTIFRCSVIREDVQIGENCDIRNFVYIDRGVIIGKNVKIMDGTYMYRGIRIEDNVFIGPKVLFLNDKHPRRDKIRDLKNIEWVVKKNASIGAGSVIQSDITLGEYSLVGAGSVVMKDVPPFGLVYGNPAKLKTFVCRNAHPLKISTFIQTKDNVSFKCKICNDYIEIEKSDFLKLSV
ncbi:N-acetyltransferase [Candidatus Woesearchaeota archaeon]|nr:N-acetyltransferase [Candidatus Woesearchaeota archaeon]